MKKLLLLLSILPNLCIYILLVFMFSACEQNIPEQKKDLLFVLPHFRAEQVDSLPRPYKAIICDVNRDGKPDIVGLATEPTALFWYENPSWDRHLITGETVNNIDAAPYDIDGDSYPDLALASNFRLQETDRTGMIHWLRNPGEKEGPWETFHIASSPMAHRLVWADTDGDGKKELFNAPIVGPGDQPPRYDIPVKTMKCVIPGDPEKKWPAQVVDHELTLLHGIMATDWDDDGREDLLTASQEGISLIRHPGAGVWERKVLIPCVHNSNARSGASEIAVGELNGRRFLATIEPWHGNELVVYFQGGPERDTWERHVVDDQLTDGHALAVEDLNYDGNDEIVAGYRQGDRSLFWYTQPEEGNWHKFPVEMGGMGSSSVDLADMDADGHTDIVAAGTNNNSIKWYRQVPYTELTGSWEAGRNLVVMEKGIHQVGFYSPGGKHIKSVRVGNHPHEMVISEDGRFAYVTDNGTMRYSEPAEGGKTISVINLETMEKTGQYELDPFRRPHAISIDYASGLLAVGVENPDRQLLMESSTGKILDHWDTRGKTPHMNSISEGAEWIYASNTQSGTIAAIRVATGETTLIEVGENPQGSALNPEGSKLFVSCRDHIAVIDTEILEVIDRIKPGALRCAVTPDGKTLVTASRWNGVGFIDVATHHMDDHIQLPFQPFSLTLSRDGKWAFTSAEPEEIAYIISVTERKVAFKFKTITGSRPDPFYDIDLQRK